MIHALQRIDASSFDQQYQDITRLYLHKKAGFKEGASSNHSNGSKSSEPTHEAMVIDLSKLEHINSLVLAFLLALKRWAIAHQTSYQITQMPPHLEGLANVYGIAELLDMNVFQI